jgi:conjugal transfer pilus assembly protein TraW
LKLSQVSKAYQASRSVAVFICLVASQTALAQETMRLGPTYPITEVDFLKSIEAKLRAKEKTGELAKMQAEAVRRNEAAIMNPKPIEGITKTSFARSFYWDPSIIITSDVKLPDGTVLAKAGSRLNPLDTTSMSKALFFFDERDTAQTAMAKRLHAERNGAVKLVLTGGSFVRLMRSWGQQVYFDQGGVLTAKFGITQVPALVAQDGKRLRIDEMMVKP